MLTPLLLLAFTFSSPSDPPTVDQLEKDIVDMVAAGRIADRKQAEPLAEAFARRFALIHDSDLVDGLADDKEKIVAWLDEHPGFRTKLFNAFEDKDDVKAAMAFFRTLWKKHADKLVKFDDLAVASVVVWDQPGNLEGSGGQVHWTKAKLPDGQVGGLENFEYAMQHDAEFGGKAQFLPWEFLVFVVDHTTPLEERAWARKYAAAAKQKKSWHQDVPYDHDMLASLDGKAGTPHLADKPYTLSNIRENGGVCMVQADFAARVGKSILMPAVYCTGDSAHREGHAWWMFVRIDAATSKGAVKCTLVSDGRFEGFRKDLFYTGTVKDPQTGAGLLDRDMERRLAVIGRDVLAKRHADECMRAYALAADKLEYTFKDRVTFVDKVLKLQPYSEAAWTELAELAKRSEKDPKQRAAILTRLNTMAKTFAAYPDFLWKLFPDLATVVEKPKERAKLYQQVIATLIASGRPDLTCAAALAFAEEFAKQDQFAEASKTLQDAVRKFPNEGRYILKVMSQLEELGAKYKGGKVEVARLYLELLPAMFAYYKSADDEYCKKMIEQASKYLDANGLSDYSAKIHSLAASANTKRKKK